MLNLNEGRNHSVPKEETPLNLYKILKGHEGETFYCEILDRNIVLEEVQLDRLRFIWGDDLLFTTYINGAESINGKCIIFPLKDQKDWIKWDKENNHKKTPKTWSELIKETDGDIYLGCHTCSLDYHICSAHGNDCSETLENTLIEKSALALLKIHKLIEVNYGGNITEEEWKDHSTIKYTINYVIPFFKRFIVTKICFSPSIIAFHTEEQAEEFLTYPENVRLLLDYFMISNLEENEKNLDS